MNHYLLAPKGATLKTVNTVHSHVHALGQCRKLIRKLGYRPTFTADTAGAAAEIAERGDTTQAAIASQLAAETYGLRVARAPTSRTPSTTRRASSSLRASRSGRSAATGRR